MEDVHGKNKNKTPQQFTTLVELSTNWFFEIWNLHWYDPRQNVAYDTIQYIYVRSQADEMASLI